MVVCKTVMKIWIFSICWNEKDMVPFYLRHYSQFSDKILVWDDMSHDGTREILSSNPKVELHDWPYHDGIKEDTFLDFSVQTYKMAIGHADWVMWVDMDEFIWGKNIQQTLSDSMQKGFQVINTEGWNMIGHGLPRDDGRQLWEISPLGVHAPTYSKPVVFQPSAEMRWIRGKHALVDCTLKVTPYPLLKLLHYRYLGWRYTASRNARNYNRCDLTGGDKSAAWSCAPGHRGEHSPGWSEMIIKDGVNVFTSRHQMRQEDL